jgi:carbon-monoxide dehydrogenase small subunit
MSAPQAGGELSAALGLGEPNVIVAVEVNGTTVTEQVPTRLNVADFLRHRLGLTGTHVGCEQGVCGMCTVLVDGEAVKSCLLFAAQIDGRRVETVESLAPTETLSPLQKIFEEEHGLQCGFCTPGFLMTATALATGGGQLTEDEIREELAGVMCRCTGYEFIVRAVMRYLDGVGAGASRDAGAVEDRTTE